MTTYQGYDVLDQSQHSREGQVRHTFNRKFNLLDTVVGMRDSDADGPAPSLDTPFTWMAVGRTEIQALKDFLLARRGRAVPFWVPSFQRDLRLNADMNSGLTAFTIRRVGYATLAYPDSNARRHLAMFELPSSAPIYRKVISASDEGATEDLVIDSTTTVALTAARSVLSFLKLCRLTNDENALEWLDNNTVRANLMFTEVPMEAP